MLCTHVCQLGYKRHKCKKKIYVLKGFVILSLFFVFCIFFNFLFTIYFSENIKKLHDLLILSNLFKSYLTFYHLICLLCLHKISRASILQFIHNPIFSIHTHYTHTQKCTHSPLE